ncbi:MAG TPA: enoyl-CoA hydratase/isomerase family protein [Candidatus Binataceae bacterium]|nr:enoyl-CoA hydratase/isomerase family protein [Candidatus Binataceae bacterium]
MLIEAKDLGDGVRLLTMNRPPANAISRDFNEAFYQRCREAREDASVRALIVTGIGRFFSAGLDLKEVLARTSGVGNLGGSEKDGIFALWTIPKPTVAMINGHAIAGGAIIALACDFRITQTGEHKFGLNETAIGLSFPIGAFEIARLALPNRAVRFGLLEAQVHPPAKALELGFVDEVVEPAKLEERCVELARRLAAGGQLAYGHTKRAIQREAVARVLSQPPEELAELAAIWTSEEARTMFARQAGSVSKK